MIGFTTDTLEFACKAPGGTMHYMASGISDHFANIYLDEKLMHYGDLTTYLGFTPGVISLRATNVDSLSISSTAVIFNEGGADVDFRVESDTIEYAFFIDGASGNIGIGAAPLTKLHIISGATITPSGGFGSTQLTISNSDGYGQIGILGSAAHGGIITFGDSTAYNLGSILYYNSSGGASDANCMAFKTADTERMRITATGRVGIGTTAPSAKLFVVDTLANVPTIKVGQTTNIGSGAIGSQIGALEFYSADTSNTGDTSTVIGTAGTRCKISAIAESDAAVAHGLQFDTCYDDGAVLGLRNAMRIASTGYVGIGTTAPEANVDILTAASTTPSMYFRASDCTHGCTTIQPTDVVGSIKMRAPEGTSTGSLCITGISEDMTQPGLVLRGISSTGGVRFQTEAIDGTGVTDATVGFQFVNNVTTLLNMSGAGLCAFGNGYAAEAKLDVLSDVFDGGFSIRPGMYLRSSVNHGMTDFYPTNVYGAFANRATGSGHPDGGLLITGLSSKYSGLTLMSLCGDTGYFDGMKFISSVKDEEGVTDVGATATAFGFYNGNTNIAYLTGEGSLTVNGGMTVGSDDAVYFGGDVSDGSWRIVRSGNDLVIERRVSGSWVTKSTITA
jgi:hypothetical protein